MNKELLEVNGYDYEDIVYKSLMGESVIIEDFGEIRPIFIKEYSMFQKKYFKYLMIADNQLNKIPIDGYISKFIILGSQVHASERVEKKEDKCLTLKNVLDPMAMIESGVAHIDNEVREYEMFTEEDIVNATEDMCNMLSMLLGTEVKYFEVEQGGKIVNGFNVKINDTVYNPLMDRHYQLIREIIMCQNGLNVPKVYDDPILQEWVDKAKNARRGKDISFNDMLIFVKNRNQVSYKDVNDMSVLQFYCDYHSHIHDGEYHSSVIYKTVSNKVPNVSIIDNIIHKIFDNSDSDLFIDIGQVMN